MREPEGSEVGVLSSRVSFACDGVRESLGTERWNHEDCDCPFCYQELG